MIAVGRRDEYYESIYDFFKNNGVNVHQVDPQVGNFLYEPARNQVAYHASNFPSNVTIDFIINWWLWS